jgi:CBS domain-containing protein
LTPRLPRLALQGPWKRFDEAKVRDVMREQIVYCAPATTLEEIADRMATFRVHSVVLQEGLGGPGSEWAIVSDLDVVAAAAERRRGVTAAGLAHRPTVTVDPDESLPVAARLMAERRADHLLVVDPARGRPVAVLSGLDIARALAAEERAP